MGASRKEVRVTRAYTSELLSRWSNMWSSLAGIQTRVLTSLVAQEWQHNRRAYSIVHGLQTLEILFCLQLSPSYICTEFEEGDPTLVLPGKLRKSLGRVTDNLVLVPWSLTAGIESEKEF